LEDGSQLIGELARHLRLDRLLPSRLRVRVNDARLRLGVLLLRDLLTVLGKRLEERLVVDDDPDRDPPVRAFHADRADREPSTQAVGDAGGVEERLL
jgi:hypothetical protein